MKRKPSSGRLLLLAFASLLLGGVAAVISGWGWQQDPGRFYPSYLIALLYWLSIPLGALAVAMIHHLTGGGWGYAIRRILEAAYATLPLLAIAFVLLLFGMPILYPWARPELVAEDQILQHKAAYLNDTGFTVRGAIYFAIWIGTAWQLNWWSRDSVPQNNGSRKLALLSGPGLILWALAVTFASIDWVMSLDPHWFSSMFGVLFMAADAVAGMSMAIIVSACLKNSYAASVPWEVSRQHDLGNFLLAFTVFWSYVTLMQFLIIWSGNLPEEAPWYLVRSQLGWQNVAISLAALHFVLPFVLLLNRNMKRRAGRLATVALLLLIMRWVDLYWLIMPCFRGKRVKLHWQDLATFLAVGGAWVALFCWILSRRILLPVYEEQEEHASNHVEVTC